MVKHPWFNPQYSLCKKGKRKKKKRWQPGCCGLPKYLLLSGRKTKCSQRALEDLFEEKPEQRGTHPLWPPLPSHWSCSPTQAWRLIPQKKKTQMSKRCVLWGKERLYSVAKNGKEGALLLSFSALGVTDAGQDSRVQ